MGSQGQLLLLAAGVGLTLASCAAHGTMESTGGRSTSGSSSGGSSTTGGASSGGTGTTSGGSSGGSSSGGFQCGQANDTVPCSGADPCPSHSSCAAGNSCRCDDGYVDVDCQGRRCGLPGINCAYPDWTCAKREPGPCGPLNFSLACDGGGYCPSNGDCAQGGCGCQPGYVALTCEGQECGNGCTYPDYWCSSSQNGYCGLGDFTVPCAGGVCPNNSLCQGGYCVCKIGFIMINCAGVDCNDPSANCVEPNYWCAPLQPGRCGPQNFTVLCDDAGINACPTNSTCSSQGCQCNPGYKAYSCHGDACTATPCQGLEYWCVPHS